MKIKILGAAGGEVTGSAYLVETSVSRILVDCGLFQGGKKADDLNQPPVVAGENLHAVVVTHGHLDHTGRLPMLVKTGYEGPVFATPATIEMAALILRDSAQLQAADAERQNRKRQRAGQPPLEPLYTAQHAEQIIQRFKPVPYQEAVNVAPGVRAIWSEAGHMLGSASIQLIIDDDGKEKRIVFSGDLGPKGAPILRDYEPFHRANVVFLESTYGNRNHRPFKETVDEFVGIVQTAVETRGKILVPTFAVGRAQLLTTLLAWMFRTKAVKPFPVFLDSPMAIEATKIYARHRELFDDDMKQFLEERPIGEDLKTLTMSVSADDSKKINDVPGPCLVLAGAGMCNGGRILHHLKHNLWRPETHVIIVGYQSHESLGRRLVEGDAMVKIHGEEVAVKSQIHTLGGFSAHAGQKDLLEWFDAIAPCKPRVVLTHGENVPRETLSQLIRERSGLKSALPELGETIEL
ncbi:MAG TPA: MBL fold metallo-hydrolase [Verrucomicrobiota bacterium]|nr:MBL fold metallo-hydrolase [Verrucomicrobiota bacterium]